MPAIRRQQPLLASRNLRMLAARSSCRVDRKCRHKSLGPSSRSRPPSVGKPTVPAGDLQDLVKRFQLQRRAFLEEQQELRKQLKQGTAAERAAIREQIRERFAEWRDSQRQHVQEVREAAKDIKNNVPSVSDIVDSAKQEGRRGR